MCLVSGHRQWASRHSEAFTPLRRSPTQSPGPLCVVGGQGGTAGAAGIRPCRCSPAIVTRHETTLTTHHLVCLFLRQVGYTCRRFLGDRRTTAPCPPCPYVMRQTRAWVCDPLGAARGSKTPKSWQAYAGPSTAIPDECTKPTLWPSWTHGFPSTEKPFGVNCGRHIKRPR